MMYNRFFMLAVALMMSLADYAHDAEIDGIYYNLYSNTKEASVTYMGKDSWDAPAEYIGAVTIPSTVTYEGVTYRVTSIGDEAFQYCEDITSVTIPNSVTSIGDWAFDSCKGLTSIKIPNSVTYIGSNVFRYCEGLTSFEIPNSITKMGGYVFENCINLSSVTIGSGLTILPSNTFENCEALESICLPNNITSIGSYAFVDCKNLKAIELPDMLETIGYNAFADCYSLTSLNIPNTVTEIRDQAFYMCASLTSVNLPDNLTRINSGLFENCYALASITLPKSVESIGSSAFWACSELKSFIIPSSVKEIGDCAFRFCTNLTSLTNLSPTPQAIDLNTFNSYDGIDLYVLKGCKEAYQNAEVWKNFGTIQEIVEGKVKLSKTKAVIEKGKTLTLKTKVYPTEEDQTVTWKSSDKKVATVTKAGKVKGVGAGTATITCTSKATGAKATCKVTVGYVKLSKTEVTLEKGEIVKLKSKVYPSTVKDQSVTWESSNPKVVKVASSGKIKGLKAGTAIITCTSNATGLKATCEVTVVKASAAPSLNGSDEDVTGIEEKATLAEEFDVYDLNGRRVLNKATSLDGLSNGVYIVNGKKVMTK